MSKYKNNTYSLRIDNILQQKIKYIAEKEDRTMNKQYERIVREYIEKYEAQHGKIKLPELENSSGGGKTDPN